MFYNNAQVFLDLCYEELMNTENQSIQKSLKTIFRIVPEEMVEEFLYAFLRDNLAHIFLNEWTEEEFENAFDLLLQDVVKDLKDQTKSMVLKVTLEGQEENLHRTLELPYGLALDEMVHMILGTFKVSSTHLYNISYKHDTFMCDLTPYSLNLVENHLYAGDYMVSELGVRKGSVFELCYDFGDNYIFNVEVTEINHHKTLFDIEDSQVLDGNGYGIWEDAHYWLDLYYDDKDYFYEMMKEEGMEEDYFAVNEEFDLDVANETLIEDYDYVCQLYDIDIDDFEL